MSQRAVAPVIGIVLMLVITVVLAGAIAAYLLVLPTTEGATQATISATVNTETAEFQFVHDGGDAIAVETLTIEITIDGEPLTSQPPVPFVGSHGFNGSPSGPFNEGGDTRWVPGQRASFRLACTNHPKPSDESTIVIELFVDDRPLTTLEIVPD